MAHGPTKHLQHLKFLFSWSKFFDTKVACREMPVDRMDEVERFLFGSDFRMREVERLFFLCFAEFGRGEASIFFEQGIERRFGIEPYLV